MWFVIMGLLALVFLGCVGGAVFSEERFLSACAAAGTLVLALGVTLAFSATTVDARAIGIQTAFGRYQTTIDSGLHFTAPWSKVEEFTTLTQNLHLNDGHGDDDGPKTPVAFKGGAAGFVTATVRWRISEGGAEKLWRDYKTFENVRDNLVKSDAQNSLRTEFSNFTPVDAIDGNNLNSIIRNVQNDLGQKLSNYGITVDSIQITNVELGKQAQQSLDRIVEANSNIQRAEAEQERAKVEAETARIRQESQTPEALQRYCLEVVNSWDVAKNGPLPATFDCDFGDSSKTPVLVGAN